jgi:EAL and modified HD-GYP domain-containing signal transduction protein
MEAMAQKVECTQEELDRAFITGMFSCWTSSWACP